jgi:hypothetical protein
MSGPDTLEKVRELGELSLLERIGLLAHQEFVPGFCNKCQQSSPLHTEINCPQHDYCYNCKQYGSFGFKGTHQCPENGYEPMWQDDGWDHDLYGNGEQ